MQSATVARQTSGLYQRKSKKDPEGIHANNDPWRRASMMNDDAVEYRDIIDRWEKCSLLAH